MTTIRHRPVLLNITGTGHCTQCNSPALILHPVVIDRVEHVLCTECQRRMKL
ncbi:MAG TPA: hypothetical protein PKK85_09040 [Methanobacteriaceae archaeon]|nr:hypothetical protein [Methanobacteriaceae archaeon]